MALAIKSRKSNRLDSYDYSQNGYYFVTVCTQGRKEWFGRIDGGKMVLNEAGQMIDRWWNEIFRKYDSILLDEYIIMPNHLYGIINIVGARLCVRPNDQMNGQTHRSAPTDMFHPALGNVLQWFKTMSTNEYIRNVKNNNWQRFDKRLWQRNYYEHVIRNEDDLGHIREYIVNNPLHWDIDSENIRNKHA